MPSSSFQASDSVLELEVKLYRISSRGDLTVYMSFSNSAHAYLQLAILSDNM